MTSISLTVVNFGGMECTKYSALMSGSVLARRFTQIGLKTVAIYQAEQPYPDTVMRFQVTAVATMIMAFFSMTNGAIVQLYSDAACTDAARSCNVYDKTCAETGGFQSFKITTSSGGGQYIRPYSQNNCGSDTTNCQGAGASSTCFEATNNLGGSNAVGSEAFPC